jgi:formate hydrogenlyase subunit 3/multisubunit Na+/H+ antiporter MnhD subunit
LFGVLLLIFYQRERLVALLATITALLLAGLAWWLPVQDRFVLGPWVINFADSVFVLGRQFTLGASDRPALVMLYLISALWFGAVPIVHPGKLFVPLGMVMAALLTAAIAVDPFLYAALFIEMGVLTSIPFLSPPGTSVGRGVLRYLTFQTLGMLFILFSGWLLEGMEGLPAEAGDVQRVAISIGLGFAFLLAVFPFYTWIPMLAQESHPYAAAFVFLVLPSAIFILLLGFLDRYVWLREAATTYEILRSAGALMIVTAGVWAAFQNRLDRILGYALIFEIGLSFINISLAQGSSVMTYLGLFFAAQVPRCLALGVWALALAILRSASQSLELPLVKGLGRRYPLAAFGLILANLSIAGLPLLAGFPVRIPILQGLFQVSPGVGYWVLLGSGGLLVAGLRIMAYLVTGEEAASWQLTESRAQRAYLIVGLLGILVLGILPQGIVPLFINLPQTFAQVIP